MLGFKLNHAGAETRIVQRMKLVTKATDALSPSHVISSNRFVGVDGHVLLLHLDQLLPHKTTQCWYDL